MAINTINFQTLGLRKGDKLLDVGCGLGRHSLLAFRDFPVEVHGVDFGFQDIVEAKNRLDDIRLNNCLGEINFTQANGYCLPFADKSFDKIICSEVLEHVPDYLLFIEELLRVLKPEGRIALSVPKYLPEKICWVLSKDYPSLAGHVRIFSKAELPDTLRLQGFSLIEHHSAHAIHSPYWWMRSLFFSAGEDFSPLRNYKKFMDWQLFNAPGWTERVESFFNPVFGKSNVYYFEKVQ